MEIHKQIKSIRQLQGLTQDEVAKEANLKQCQVSRIERGMGCTLGSIKKILQVLGYQLAAIPVEQTEGGKNGSGNKGL